MSTFRAFQTGLEAGQKQAKVKREDDARMKASEAFGSGNYEGAVSSLMGVGLMDDANAYGQAGERKKEAERTQAYAQAFKTGLGAGPMPDRKAGYQALGQAAGERGDFGTMQAVDQALAGMDADQAAKFGEGMNFLGQTALGLKGVPPEARGQAAMEILQNSPYANPQIMQQIQQAAADGKITDEELDNFAMQTMSVAERVKMQREAMPKPAEPFTLSPGQRRYNPDGSLMASAPETPKAAADNAPSPPTAYQQWQMQRGDAADARVAEAADAKKATTRASLNEGIGLVNQLVTHPGLSAIYGAQGALPRIPGTPGADAEALLEQIGGQAFLAGIESLKGTGPLSDREGQAVKSARTRLLNRGQSVEAAKAAAKEFTDSMQRLLAAYEQEAGSASAGVNPAAVATPAMQMGIRAYATQSGLPAEAITEFLSNSATPQEIAEFNDAFGDGAAEAILKAMQGGR